ncbi:DNA damage-inducible protein 1 [Coemansia erecta]|uniref:DNA damage-inducible protein 1 n=1 Tax=Coemansia erecta TaxID=147472 RepID=A0A9W7XWI1_9FUNG|nr:DNA damage-inducible protein 1 [Coemansia erecta]
MRLTFTQVPDKIEEFEVGESLELGDLRALLELNFDIPIDRQRLVYKGIVLEGNSKTLGELGVEDQSLIHISDSSQQQQHQSYGAPAALSPQLEAHRQQVLRNPALMQQLRQTHPEIAQAVQNDPSEFGRLMNILQQRQAQIQQQQEQEMANLDADPFDVESQRRIEEAIRQQNIMQNMATALELNPESFATVTMLFLDVTVNGTPIKALVDSGAQATVMSKSCAERCGIMRLVDTRFSGEARGVGRAKILGRVHNAQLGVGKQTLLCSFTVMEGAHISLLFGLDMLKRHLACIDLKQNALVINDEVIEFLPEHQIPKMNEEDDDVPEGSSAPGKSIDTATPPAPVVSTSGAPFGSAAASNMAQRQMYQQKQQYQQQQQHASPSQQQSSVHQSAQQPRHPEEAISALMNLGVSREEAIRHLDAAGGNLDMAASLIFS